MKINNESKHAKQAQKDKKRNFWEKTVTYDASL